MKTRFLEVEGSAKLNHGKFLIGQFGEKELAYPSAIFGAPLLASLPPTRRFGGALGASDVLLVDLQTQEGLFFDPTVDDATLRRRFLVHPLHVCILFFPAMRLIATAARLALAERGSNDWRLPPLMTVDLGEVVNQPGLLIDTAGHQVRGLFEWSGRQPIGARFRNREVPLDGDPEAGQGELTPEEQAENVAGRRPTW